MSNFNIINDNNMSKRSRDYFNESYESNNMHQPNEINNMHQPNERIPPPVAAPVAQEEDRPEDLVPIGTGRTLIRRDMYNTVNWKTYNHATRTLLRAVFSKIVLSTHCLSGKPSPAFPHKPAKMCLDKQKVTDIIIEIKERFEVKESIIRNVIKSKCSDESKMMKIRQKRQMRL